MADENTYYYYAVGEDKARYRQRIDEKIPFFFFFKWKPRGANT